MTATTERSEGPVVEWLRAVAEGSDVGWIVACVMALLNAVMYIDKRLYQRYRDRLADAAEWSDEQQAWNDQLQEKVNRLDETVSELREQTDQQQETIESQQSTIDQQQETIDDQQDSIDRLCQFIDGHADVETSSDEIIS